MYLLYLLTYFFISLFIHRISIIHSLDIAAKEPLWRERRREKSEQQIRDSDIDDQTDT
jgi:hypothetical protein